MIVATVSPHDFGNSTLNCEWHVFGCLLHFLVQEILVCKELWSRDGHEDSMFPCGKKYIIKYLVEINFCW